MADKFNHKMDEDDDEEFDQGDKAGVRKDLAKMLQNPAAFAEAIRDIEQQKLDEFLTELPLPVRRRVKALKKLQLDAVKLEADFFKKVHEIECGFAQQFAKLNDKRRDIVRGDYEPTDVEADFPLFGTDAADELSKEMESKAKMENGETKEDAKGVPEFWLTVFKHVDILSEMVQEHDEPILKQLTDIELKLSNSPMTFTLLFHFAPNEHFSNATLTKEYTLKCDPDPTMPFEFDGPEIIACKGTTIDWKPTKNVTVKQIKKKQKNKNKGQTRFVTKEVKQDSFFNFFDPPAIPEQGVELMDEETRDLLNADFEIGQILRDRIIPRAVLYYTGEAADESFDEEEDEEDEEYEDEDEDEDDDVEGHQVP